MNATAGITLKASSVGPAAPVPMAVDRIDNAITRLQDALHDVHERIAPIAKPEEPQPAKDGGAAPHGNVPLAERLHELAQRIEGLAGGMERLLDRLGI